MAIARGRAGAGRAAAEPGDLRARGGCGHRRSEAAPRQCLQSRPRETYDRASARARVGEVMKPLVGTGIDRVDGKKKVTGGATYAAEVQVANVAHAVLVGSTIGRGRIKAIETDAAAREPG